MSTTVVLPLAESSTPPVEVKPVEVKPVKPTAPKVAWTQTQQDLPVLSETHSDTHSETESADDTQNDNTKFTNPSVYRVFARGMSANALHAKLSTYGTVHYLQVVIMYDRERKQWRETSCFIVVCSAGTYSKASRANGQGMDKFTIMPWTFYQSAIPDPERVNMILHVGVPQDLKEYPNQVLTGLQQMLDNFESGHVVPKGSLIIQPSFSSKRGDGVLGGLSIAFRKDVKPEQMVAVRTLLNGAMWPVALDSNDAFYLKVSFQFKKSRPNGEHSDSDEKPSTWRTVKGRKPASPKTNGWAQPRPQVIT
jgi:hypothetical protein